MNQNPTNKDFLDWEELSPADKVRVETLLSELNTIFDETIKRKDECKDSNLTE